MGRRTRRRGTIRGRRRPLDLDELAAELVVVQEVEVVAAPAVRDLPRLNPLRGGWGPRSAYQTTSTGALERG